MSGVVASGGADPGSSSPVAGAEDTAHLSSNDQQNEAETFATPQSTPVLPRAASSASLDSSSADTGYQSTFTHMTIGTIATLASAGVHHTKSQWRILLAGQILSLLMAGYGAASASLAFECGLSAPAFQTLPLYAIMSMHGFGLWCNSCFGSGRKKTTNSGTAMTEQVGKVRGGARRLFGRLLRRRGGKATNGDEDDNNCGTDNGNTNDDAESTATTPKYHLFKKIKLLPLHTSPLYYLIIAILDVEANYLTYLALRYTTLNAVALFDSVAIPSAMIVSRVCLGRQYRFTHILGAAICMAGVLSNCFSEYDEMKDDEMKEEALEEASIAAAATTTAAAMIPIGGEQEPEWEENLTAGDNPIYPHRIMGDFIALFGGILYGVADVLREKAVHGPGGFSEYITMIGIFGTVISVIQAAALETEEIAQFLQPPDVGKDGECPMNERFKLLAGYTVGTYAFYIGVSRFLYVSEAALLNLSLLTCDLWTVIFVVAVQRIVPDPLFSVALALITFGVVVYEIAPSPVEPSDFGKNPDFTISACMGHAYSEDDRIAGGGGDPRREDEQDFAPTGWDAAADEEKADSRKDHLGLELAEHAGTRGKLT